mmetsp:Transcript_21414/g.43113  ORF Transcript_21414/g.43113 Transcript_21414/m.43113 type:complete len:119 (-) Transcript_21414:141-497(-)
MRLTRRSLCFAAVLLSMLGCAAAEEEGAAIAEESEADAKQILSEFDGNGDGQLELHEILKGLFEAEEEGGQDPEETQFREQVVKHFKSADEDQNGALNLAEIQTLAKFLAEDFEGQEF